MTSPDEKREGISADLAQQLERAYTGSDDLTLAQMRRILQGLADIRDAENGMNASAVAALLADCGAGHLSVESVDVLVHAVSELDANDPVQHIPLKRLEDLLTQIS